MFVIAGLVVLLLYNGIELNECPNSDGVKSPVGALNFFLFFIVPLFIFNYFGSLYHSESGLSKALQGVFFTFLIIWWFALVFWAFHKLKIRNGVFPKFENLEKFKNLFKDCCSFFCCCRKPKENSAENYWNVFYFIMGGLVAPLLIFLWYFLRDLSQAFLFTCIAESIVAVSAKTKILQKLFALCCKGCKCERTCNCSDKCTCERTAVTRKEILQVFYIVITACVLAGAVSIFLALPTTDKTSSPEESRNNNEECQIFGFFDWHDLWHFLSSFALLMGAFVIMFISAESVQSNVNSGRVCAGTTQENAAEINENERDGGNKRRAGKKGAMDMEDTVETKGVV
ncbi:uncharacterized protein LOC144659640 [Oculina patagonica]